MPTNWKLAHAHIPEAEYLADLYGIQFDLDSARQICNEVLVMEGSYDHSVASALVSAAIVHYMRCFSGGRRYSLDHEIFRDKFIAHPINAFEDSFVNVMVGTEDGELLPAGPLSPGLARLMLGKREVSRQLKLIEFIDLIVKAKIGGGK